MFKNKRILLVLSLAMALMVFTGCQNADETAEEDPVAVEEEEIVEEEETEEEEEVEIDDEVSLADWEGSWNSMAAYLDDEELEPAFEDLAEREDMSVEEAKTGYLEDIDIGFDGLIIEDNKAIFLDGFEQDSGEILEEREYEYKEMVIAKHGNFDAEWYAFESEEEGAYEFLLLMPVHGEEALTHFHLRYGESIDELLANEDWYPTFVRPDSTYDQLYEEITE